MYVCVSIHPLCFSEILSPTLMLAQIMKEKVGQLTFCRCRYDGQTASCRQGRRIPHGHRRNLHGPLRGHAHHDLPPVLCHHGQTLSHGRAQSHPLPGLSCPCRASLCKENASIELFCKKLDKYMNKQI